MMNMILPSLPSDLLCSSRVKGSRSTCARILALFFSTMILSSWDSSSKSFFAIDEEPQFGSWIPVRELNVLACSGGEVSGKRVFEFLILCRLCFEKILDGNIGHDPLIELVPLVVSVVGEHCSHLEIAVRQGILGGRAMRTASGDAGNVVTTVIREAQNGRVLTMLSAS